MEKFYLYQNSTDQQQLISVQILSIYRLKNLFQSHISIPEILSNHKNLTGQKLLSFVQKKNIKNSKHDPKIAHVPPAH